MDTGNTQAQPSAVTARKLSMVEKAVEAVKIRSAKKFDIALNDLVEAHGVEAARKILVASDQRISTKA